MSDPARPLALWTVYDHPSDQPDCFIARKFLIVAGGPIATEETRAARTLQPLRDSFELEGLYCLPREPNDDPKIIESWL